MNTSLDYTITLVYKVRICETLGTDQQLYIHQLRCITSLFIQNTDTNIIHMNSFQVLEQSIEDPPDR